MTATGARQHGGMRMPVVFAQAPTPWGPDADLVSLADVGERYLSQRVIR